MSRVRFVKTQEFGLLVFLYRENERDRKLPFVSTVFLATRERDISTRGREFE